MTDGPAILVAGGAGFMMRAWVDHVDQHVHLDKTGAEVTSHWQHGRQ